MTAKYTKDQPAGFTNRIERITIVGAGGTIGYPIAEELLATGKHTITAITRPGSTNSLPVGLKTIAVPYDSNDGEAALVDALRGQQVLIICLWSQAPPDTHHRLVVAAAKAGVPYVIPNGYGWVWLDDDEKKRKESLHGEVVYQNLKDVEAQGVSSWISVHCSFWYDFSLSMGERTYGFTLPDKKVTFFDNGEKKIWTTTTRQVGRAIAKLFSLKELPEDENDQDLTVARWKNRPLRVGSFNVSQRDMLDSVHRVMGTTDEDWTITKESSVERRERGLKLMATGPRHHDGFVLALYASIFLPDEVSWFGKTTFDEEEVDNQLLGLPKEDLDEATKLAVDIAVRMRQ
ncbi:NAD(P)-binding protein [Neurospora crassa]|uniref:CipA protein n=2 Tax=Neurospora crassa TaxID=5141 RepID=Q1K761_NEUCR|nr:CipA protein [Neurospora crassa OR74A]EAA31809.1 CipA protein [Neurospora crassa OR74A]KHE88235.1 NAD(P)-binding protein [Neurospora crassa]CAB88574.1 hypothetical protein [Neurospora crassa]|eukprot:XP_961045.1 CipA protein [Neurospora crassa OR74A]